jgi:eukaryotic-like serine/threonine-protein kinase
VTKLLAKDGEGERLDRFELIAELASGGMATVFLARLSGVAGFQRLVAIKRLHPHLAREAEFVEMFLDEARLAARIHHPNVVPIQEVGESDLGYYLVMDYIEGDTLAHMLARAAQSKTSIPNGVIIRVLLDVLAGLHAAHELKDDSGEPLSIVHRDVSPQNILVGVDGVARLVDFGVARATARLATTRSGQLKGKLAYMAPEQARGADIDRRADLFSCGIVLWEALAVKRLFKSEGEAATLNRVLYDPILPPSSVRRDVPKALEDVCMKALEREPDKRYATAQDFADDLERAARAIDTIGSVRDVAACLQEVVGTDLNQQRDAVRAWLTRSEPSRSKRLSRPPPPESVTRIEGGSRSEPSGRTPPSLRSNRDFDRQALTAPAPPEPLEKVSSVSSAVIPRPDSPSAAPPPAGKSRAPLVVGVGLALVLLLGLGAWGAMRMNAPPVVTNHAGPPPSAAAPVDTVPPGAATSPAAASSPTASSTAEPPPSASVAPKPTQKPAIVPRPRPPASSRPGVPDDLNSNPYR